MTTSFTNKLSILSDLWLNYRNTEEFTEFIEFHDMGLPLAYLLESKIVKPTELATKLIDETFAALLSTLGQEDLNFNDFDEILGDVEDDD